MGKISQRKKFPEPRGADDFLEAIKDLGPANYPPKKNQGRGEITRGASVNLGGFAEQAEALEKRYQERFYLQAERIRREERLVYDGKERQILLQTKALQEELSQLAKATDNLGKEVEIATFQTPVSPGIYHVSFFEKLRAFIKVFKSKIDSSAAWLSAFNARAKKKNYYWGQVKKSGSKFMLSADRYMATQAG
ncbi:hypothetical protein FJZ40_01190 [Candidatus Shapirobacteria bacterium]|nr:hypothetical protein [Candidatus Shapirobacteria bacterium]